MPSLVRTEHPHIVRLEGVCGGEPVVDSLRVTVRHVATLHRRGESIPEIAEALGLTEAQVYHALSYYYDHRAEIDALMAQEEQACVRLLETWKPLHSRSIGHIQRLAPPAEPTYPEDQFH